MSADTSNTPNSLESFSASDREYLAQRAVPLDFAYAAGLRSVPPQEALRKAIRSSYAIAVPKGDALMVLYGPSMDGVQRVRIRPHGHFDGTEGADETFVAPESKWLAQKGVPVAPYFPPQIETLLKDASVPLYVVEAPVKALAMTAHGFPAIGLGGVDAGFLDVEVWRAKRDLKLHPEMQRLNWDGRTVHIVYDANLSTNAHVANGAAKLFMVLSKAGADVRIVFLPLVKASDLEVEHAASFESKDQGPDDLLFRFGKERMQELIDCAVPADPLRWAEEIASDKDTRTARAASFAQNLYVAASLKLGGQVLIAQVAQALKGTGMGTNVLKGEVKKFNARVQVGMPESPSSYETKDNRVVMAESQAPLSEFSASIAEEIVRDTGAETSLEYRIQGTLASGAALPTLTVSATDFKSLDWAAQWGAKAIVHPGRDTKDHLRAGIQFLSNPIRRTVYAHTGWREINGKQVYLHPKGAIGTDQYIEVELQNLRGYGLPTEPATSEELQRAVQTSLRLRECGSLQVTLPILAFGYLSPLASALSVDFSAWVVGRSGSKKSGYTGLVCSHFGEFDYRSLPGSWFSSVNAIEVQLHKLKDCCCPVDNYVVGKTAKEQSEMSSKALRILQNLGDRAGRATLTRDRQERQAPVPRAVMIATAEDLPPTNESTIGRTLVIDVPADAISLARVKEAQDDAHLLQVAMRGYIEWLAAHYDEQVERARRFRRAMSSNGFDAELPHAHDRTAGNLATLYTGYDTFLIFALRCGAISSAEYHELKAEAWCVLVALGKKQRVNTEGSPADQFLATLASMLQTGEVSLAGVGESLTMAQTREAQAVGWEDSRTLYLNQALVFRAVERFHQGRWPFKPRTILNELRDRGVLLLPNGMDGEGRLEMRKRLGGRQERVIAIRSDAVFAESASEPDAVDPTTLLN